ncbi:MAG: UDP-N-acetylmuramate--L-alanine ligase [Endomicrobium sp.]|jgi:UDP-N-acetylmuramate--alanine ligase|nr:UDP-N-acetylmuramate--L-alanine ligase [Endomicrobium sp.]
MKLKAMSTCNSNNIYLIGIGGVGMAGIAEVLINLGYNVYGSDVCNSDLLNYLISIGVKVYIGHNSENINNIKNIDIVVISSAIPKTNPELILAYNRKLHIISRGEMLAQLANCKSLITIAGTHGKTTVSAMISFIMQKCNLGPTFIVGGRLRQTKSGAKLGDGQYMIVEADESDGSFLQLKPKATVVTNIDNDHLEHYDNNIYKLKSAFTTHINGIPSNGIALLCSDNENILHILNNKQINIQYLTYGLKGKPSISACNIKFHKNVYTSFDINYMGTIIGNCSIQLIGIHNVLNSLAVIGVCLWLKIPIKRILNTIKLFKGVARRLEIKGKKNGIIVIDDYGHHPTEIIASINAIKSSWPNHRLVVLFQPHRYTRTKHLMSAFCHSFFNANLIQILDIYSAGEPIMKTITSDLLVSGLRKLGCNATKFISVKHLLTLTKHNDIILTIGAGSIWKISNELINEI